ncbi:PREDICTED: GPI-anchored protein LORELEI-like [Nelumbo nucifera]|uniref:GPI-anchored protein LORELEI-like n=2 Tax=Nelumbo nucifera TaxID=4432 RepID=A0A1U7ZWJ8_NELNU|nr:PREDICTED: GPI-anchored protein LORELEI-like [Nelumbo nucifera]DAD47734.1 TPA_asm: hypothetical protein HUJ06_017671 [Nelumbo nucifera]
MPNRCLSVVLFFLLTGLTASSSFVSNNIFESHGYPARNLLQTKKECTVNFENLDYTIFKNQCKGPQFPPELCCAALKEFACPYAAEINDLNSNCASTMLSYITQNEGYPPGLFSSECREGKDGLKCNATAPVGSSNGTSGAQIGQILLPFLLFVSSSLVLLLLQML